MCWHTGSVLFQHGSLNDPKHEDFHNLSVLGTFRAKQATHTLLHPSPKCVHHCPSLLLCLCLSDHGQEPHKHLELDLVPPSPETVSTAGRGQSKQKQDNSYELSGVFFSSSRGKELNVARDNTG